MDYSYIKMDTKDAFEQVVEITNHDEASIYNAQPVIAQFSKQDFEPKYMLIKDLVDGRPRLLSHSEFPNGYQYHFNKPPHNEFPEHDDFYKHNDYINYYFKENVGNNHFIIDLKDDNFESAIESIKHCLPSELFTEVEHYVITQVGVGTTIVLKPYLYGNNTLYNNMYGLILDSLVKSGEAALSLDLHGNIKIEHDQISWMTSLDYILPISLSYDPEKIDIYSYDFQNQHGLHAPYPWPDNTLYIDLMETFRNEHVDEIVKLKHKHKSEMIVNSFGYSKQADIESAIALFDMYSAKGMIMPGLKLKSPDKVFTYRDVLNDPEAFDNVAIENPFNPVDGVYDTFIFSSNLNTIHCVRYTNFITKRFEFVLDSKTFLAQLKIDNGDRFNSHQEFDRVFAQVEGKMDFEDYKAVQALYARNPSAPNLKKLTSRFYEDNGLEHEGSTLVQSKANFEKVLSMRGCRIFFDRVKKVSGIVNFNHLEKESRHLWNMLDVDLSDIGFTDKKLIKRYIDEVVNEVVDSGFFLRRSNHIPKTDGYEQFEQFISAFEIDHKFGKEYFAQLIELTLIAMVAASDGATRSPRADKLNCYENILVFYGEGDLYKSKMWRRMFNGLKESDHFLGETSPDIKPESKNKASFLTYLVYEISEINKITTNPKLEDAFKSFFSSTEDVLYTTGPNKGRSYERASIAVGSTNKSVYLQDDNTRRVNNIDLISIDDAIIREVDYESLFKYIADKYLAGAKWWLTKEDSSLKKALHDSNLKHHKNGKFKLLANELLNIISQNRDGRVSMNTKKIYIALTGVEPDTFENSRFADALKDKEVLAYNEKGCMFKVSNIIQSMYDENIVKLVKSA
ncbi:MAG: VapE family protein [Sulfuricurvum sp.]|nr:VapE family protein [Sulfuricurvum sp.]